MTRHRLMLATATPLVLLALAGCTDEATPTPVSPVVPVALKPSGPQRQVGTTSPQAFYTTANDTLFITNPSLTVADGSVFGGIIARVEGGSDLTFTGHYKVVRPVPCDACGTLGSLIGWALPDIKSKSDFAEIYHSLASYRPNGSANIEGDFTWTTRAPTSPGVFRVGGAVGQPLSQFALWVANLGYESKFDLVNRNYQSFQVTVLEPVMLSVITGTLGGDSWYRSDVAVDWTIRTAMETIESSSGCGTTTVSSDTPSQTVTCTVNASNGVKTKSVTVKRDATKPTVTITGVTPPPNANGWNSTDVVVTWNCTDLLSGAQSPNGSKTATGEGANRAADATCTDVAGNGATTPGVYKIDRTPPALAPTLPDTVDFKAIVSATPNATDALSSIDTQTCGPVITTLAGKFSLTCSATDKAGNTATKTVSYVVRSAYTFGGFQSPIAAAGLNSANAGSAVPVKFSLGGDKGLNILATGSPSSKALTCPAAAPVTTIAEAPTASSGSNGLQYDARTGVYTYVWKTDKSWASSCRTLVLTFIDGTAYTADFRFTK